MLRAIQWKTMLRENFHFLKQWMTKYLKFLFESGFGVIFRKNYAELSYNDEDLKSPIKISFQYACRNSKF